MPDRSAPFRLAGDGPGETLTAPAPIAPARTRSMFRKRATILRILRCSLVMTIHATAPAYAEPSFGHVVALWMGSGSVEAPRHNTLGVVPAKAGTHKPCPIG
jgi:hypothetical protein